MNLLFMLLHGDCPSIQSGGQPPQMKLVKAHPDGRTIEYYCFGCDGRVRLTQRILNAPVAKAAVVESGPMRVPDAPPTS